VLWQFTTGLFCLQRKHLTWQVFHNIGVFLGEELLAPRPTHYLDDHSLSAVRGCLFNIFKKIPHIGGRSSIRNLRTRHAVVTGTHIYGTENTPATNSKLNLFRFHSSVCRPLIKPFSDNDNENVAAYGRGISSKYRAVKCGVF
jgi:hypothetical protein